MATVTRLHYHGLQGERGGEWVGSESFIVGKERGVVGRQDKGGDQFSMSPKCVDSPPMELPLVFIDRGPSINGPARPCKLAQLLG